MASRNSCKPGLAHSSGGSSPEVSGRVSRIAILFIRVKVKEIAKPTIINIQHQKLLPFTKWSYDVDLELLRCLFYLPSVALIIQVGQARCWVLREVHVQVVDDVREAFKF